MNIINVYFQTFHISFTLSNKFSIHHHHSYEFLRCYFQLFIDYTPIWINFHPYLFLSIYLYPHCDIRIHSNINICYWIERRIGRGSRNNKHTESNF
jgi:hypothetical protein